MRLKMEKNKPCQLCNSTEIVICHKNEVYDENFYRYECDNCGLASEFGSDEGEAAEYWNKLMNLLGEVTK
jgi:transcription elongation factor Elf1